MKTTDTHYDRYQSPLVQRNASPEMSGNFSPNRKFGLWRRLWIALAEAERELGLPITKAQIDQMRRFRDKINYRVAEARERQVRHDVMSHVYAFGVQCPKAKPIIHLGATSCYVTENGELIQLRDGMLILRRKLLGVIDALAMFAKRHRALPTLGLTHLQPAQPTTVGKRACLWLQEFVMDWHELQRRIDALRFRGVKGTTGTQASFMELFDRDERKVKALDRLVAQKMGFSNVFTITGQTYTRKVDAQVCATLAGIAQSAAKMATDLRLLQSLHLVEEPFGRKQIGSSAMPYKRNPIRCERINALARYAICTAQNAPLTAAAQWMERTLDDSANRRIVLAEMFLAVDGILLLCHNVASGLVVNERVIAQHLARELPFLCTEAILMAAAKAGGDRQELHERIRRHALAAARIVKEQGGSNDLLGRLAADPAFAKVKSEIEAAADPSRLIGRAPRQVDEFLRREVQPILRKHRAEIGAAGELNV